MFFIIGLGNPGLRYKKTRHNIGFRVLDQFKKENNFPGFKLNKKFKAEISESTLDNQKIILAKPQTYMNSSGKAIKLISNFQFPPASAMPKALRAGPISNQFPINQFSNKLIVVHDDLDILLGSIKVSKNKSAAGHKGVESIINALGTQNFIRLRVGVKATSNVKCQNSKSFVLKKFSKDEEKILSPAIKKASQALKLITTDNIEKAMNEVNK